MTSIAARLSQKELDYLTEIASTQKLYKGDSEELSLGKALKEVIKWCQSNQIDISKTHQSMDNDIKKMIEHIHVSIPHLMYLSRLQTLINSDNIPDEKVKICRQQTIDYLNKVCGDFQHTSYNEVRFSMNDIGLKTTPSDKDKTQWTLP